NGLVGESPAARERRTDRRRCAVKHGGEMKRIFVVAAAAVAVSVAAGCSTLGKAAFADPVVTLKDVKVVGIGLTGGNVDVVLSVYNPNGFRLDATKLTYNLFVDSTKLGDGV